MERNQNKHLFRKKRDSLPQPRPTDTRRHWTQGRPRHQTGPPDDHTTTLRLPPVHCLQYARPAWVCLKKCV